MSLARRWTAAAALAAGFTLVLLPAAADWLVMRDGSRVETAGPWRVESRLVVFKQPDGTFASVRLDDVDLDASARVTREEAERAAQAKTTPEPQPARSEPVLRLTEKDLPPVAYRPAPEGEQGAADGSEKAPPPLEIVTWREVSEIGGPGVEIVGTVRNNSDSLAIGLGVTAVLYDHEDRELARTQAILTSTALQPTQSSGFRASFPGVYEYARADLKADGNLVTTEVPEAEQPPADTSG